MKCKKVFPKLFLKINSELHKIISLQSKEVIFNNSSVAQFHLSLLYLHYLLRINVCTYLIKGETPGCKVGHHYNEKHSM